MPNFTELIVPDNLRFGKLLHEEFEPKLFDHIEIALKKYRAHYRAEHVRFNPRSSCHYHVLMMNVSKLKASARRAKNKIRSMIKNYFNDSNSCEESRVVLIMNVERDFEMNNYSKGLECDDEAEQMFFDELKPFVLNLLKNTPRRVEL